MSHRGGVEVEVSPEVLVGWVFSCVFEVELTGEPESFWAIDGGVGWDRLAVERSADGEEFSVGCSRLTSSGGHPGQPDSPRGAVGETGASRWDHSRFGESTGYQVLSRSTPRSPWLVRSTE